MNQYVIATVKSWNIKNAYELMQQYPEDTFTLITDKDKLTEDLLEKIKPRFVFFPHWSWMIPESICRRFSCVVFHMTDLPFGRGGSPLQNLLERGIYETKVTAIKAEAGIDTGPVYGKETADISEGSADEILQKISAIIFKNMIPRFLQEELQLSEQKGEALVFKRRLPEQSEIPDGLSPRQVYDYIMMLDGEGYPAAYIKTGSGRICFRNARLKNDAVFADAEFRGDASDEKCISSCRTSG